MIDTSALAAAVDEARAVVQADGADFELVGVDDELGQVDLRLLLVEAGCAECVMPRQFLEGVVLDILHKAVPNVRAVRVDDPRVEESYALLHQLRLRGMMRGAETPGSDALCTAGLAARKGTFLVLTSAGREVHSQWARLTPGSEAESAARRSYDQFLALNPELLQVSTDWQVRPGNVPNDHRDTKYDWDVLDRLAAIDERTGPILRRLGEAVERFAGYRPRLRDALRRVQDGEHDWFLSPTCDSYHTVWMQLHEDLLLALGLARTDESPGSGA
jgi:hypothetical protein